MQAPEKSEENPPKIVEAYRDFSPPATVRPMIEELLRSVPSQYLRGLSAIILRNQSSITGKERRRKTWSRNQRIHQTEALGFYSQATRSSQATITLHVDNILDSTPSWFLRVPVLRYAGLGITLFHEIGHHIHAAHRPVHEGKENVAEEWSVKLGRQFIRQRYWYLLPVLYPIGLAFRLRKQAPPFLRRWKRRLSDEISER
jgi:hypothetical protein